MLLNMIVCRNKLKCVLTSFTKVILIISFLVHRVSAEIYPFFLHIANIPIYSFSFSKIYYTFHVSSNVKAFYANL